VQENPYPYLYYRPAAHSECVASEKKLLANDVSVTFYCLPINVFFKLRHLQSDFIKAET